MPGGSLTAPERCADPTISPDPERVTTDRGTAARLAERIAQLSPEQQRCLRLRFWQGLSTAETAAVLRRTESCVQGFQHRAVRTFTQLLPEGVA